MIYTTNYNSPIGQLQIAEKDGGLIGLWTEGQKYYFDSIKEETIKQNTPSLQSVQSWLDRYFAGEKPTVAELNLKPLGSPFRQEVWRLLCQIPYGEVITYGEIARQIAAKMGKTSMSAQAIGGAVGHNPISIIIPCHRVIGAKGNLTGYAGGLQTKIKLLEHEGVDLSSFFIPKRGTAL
ncbi:MAG: methylated-DNA--[protein]-cysteine S-methyltransferase [Tissierellia bacterium]|nr:methylated-DNA--[protein]-cysteine S-methyltransferase [Tissierellia bacterium]